MILIGIAIGGAIGVVIALRIPMTAMPQLVAAFHSLVGMAAVFVAAAALYNPAEFHITTPAGAIKGASLFEMGLGVIIGAITFSGSVIAFAKLQALHAERADPAAAAPPDQPRAIGAAILLLLILFVATESTVAFWLMTLLAFAIGFLLIIPIGGADMPVVISMLNSYSGWAAAGIGFTLNNPALIITGALVGSSGAILSYIMCKAMNRSFVSVILGGFGESGAAVAAVEDRTVKPGSADDAAFIMKNARSVIIVPGYGMAVAQAQHAVRELMDTLGKEGVEVKFAIHPVAGRMPGHMNVLLAEANVPYDVVHEMEEVNNDFQSTDVAYVIGANDITNPAAKEDPQSPIYGMPVLDVDTRTGGVLRQALDGAGLRRHRQHAVLQGQHDDAVRRRQEDDRGDRPRDGVSLIASAAALPAAPRARRDPSRRHWPPPRRSSAGTPAASRPGPRRSGRHRRAG